MPVHLNFSLVVVFIHDSDSSLMFFQELGGLVLSHVADRFIWFILQVLGFFQLKFIVIFNKVQFFIQLILTNCLNFIDNFRLILRRSQFILCIFNPFLHQYIDFLQPFLHKF
jgi:hypothetical protein